VGSEDLFSDPTARRLEFNSPDVVPHLNPMLDQMVMVSPRLALIHTQQSAADWVKVLTARHHLDASSTAIIITWRKPHQQPAIFAAPEMLQTRSVATRREDTHRARPSRMSRYRQAQVFTHVQGPLGPDPDQLLSAMLEHIQLALGRTTEMGTSEDALEPGQCWIFRDGTGLWKGSFVHQLPDIADAIAVHQLMQGSTLQVGATFAMISVRNSRLDADPALCQRATGNARGGGR